MTNAPPKKHRPRSLLPSWLGPLDQGWWRWRLGVMVGFSLILPSLVLIVNIAVPPGKTRAASGDHICGCFGVRIAIGGYAVVCERGVSGNQELSPVGDAPRIQSRRTHPDRADTSRSTVVVSLSRHMGTYTTQ